MVGETVTGRNRSALLILIFQSQRFLGCSWSAIVLEFFKGCWGWRTISFCFLLHLIFLLSFLFFAYKVLRNTLYDSRITDGVLFTLLTSEVENAKDNFDDLQPKKVSEFSLTDKILGLPRSLFGKWVWTIFTEKHWDNSLKTSERGRYACLISNERHLLLY